MNEPWESIMEPFVGSLASSLASPIAFPFPFEFTLLSRAG